MIKAILKGCVVPCLLFFIGCMPVVVDQPVGTEVGSDKVRGYAGEWTDGAREGTIRHDSGGRMTLEFQDKDGQRTIPLKVTQVGDATIVWLYAEEFSGYVFGRVVRGEDEQGFAVLAPEVAWVRQQLENGSLEGEELENHIRLESPLLESIMPENNIWHLNRAWVLRLRQE